MLFLVLLLVAGQLRAALTWERLRAEVTVKPGENAAVASFRFTNPGPKPVRLTTVQPGCDCLRVEVAKRDFATGESGQIDVRMDLTDRAGPQENEVLVGTDEEPDRRTILKIKVNIPEVVRCTPQMTVWRRSEPLAEKAVDVVVVAPSAELAAPVFNLAEIAVRVETVEAGRHYRLVLRPTSTAPDGVRVVRCKLALADARTYAFSVYGMVKP